MKSEHQSQAAKFQWWPIGGCPIYCVLTKTVVELVVLRLSRSNIHRFFCCWKFFILLHAKGCIKINCNVLEVSSALVGLTLSRWIDQYLVSPAEAPKQKTKPVPSGKKMDFDSFSKERINLILADVLVVPQQLEICRALQMFGDDSSVIAAMFPQASGSPAD